MKVTVIGHKNAAALIEYVIGDMPYRGIVPLDTVNGNEVPDDVILLAIPYGVAWAEILTPRVTPDDLQRELRRRGIWTATDAQNKPNEVIAAASAAYGLDVAAILRAANTIAREEIKHA